MKDCLGLRLDRFELAVLAILTCVAGSAFVPILGAGRPLSGAVGLWPEDQLQYFAWVRESAHHLLIGNPFDIASTARRFLHPAFAISGLVHAATGLSIPLSFYLWEPVALLLLFIGYRAYVRRLATGQVPRGVALSLTLLAISPLFVALELSGMAPPAVARAAALYASEVWTAGIFWGYPVTALSLALMPLALLGVESWRRTRRPRTLCLTCAASLLMSWIHPWQGAVVVVLILSVEGLRYFQTREPPSPGLLLVLAASMLPAIYYEVLTILDPVWRTYRAQSAKPRAFLAPVLALLPLAAPAAVAYRLPAVSWQEQAVRIWPLAALLVYLLPAGTYPIHSLQGVALPLGILAVQGAQSLGWKLQSKVVIGLVIGAMLLPGWEYQLRTLRTLTSRGGWYFILPGEKRALKALEHDRRPGGVLATVWPGMVVPSATGRKVYVGHESWSPDFPKRAWAAGDLFSGRLTGHAAQEFVRASRARFLLAGCGQRADLTKALGDLVVQVRRYDCATVYDLIELSPMGRAAGPPDD